MAGSPTISAVVRRPTQHGRLPLDQRGLRRQARRRLTYAFQPLRPARGGWRRRYGGVEFDQRHAQHLRPRFLHRRRDLRARRPCGRTAPYHAARLKNLARQSHQPAGDVCRYRPAQPVPGTTWPEGRSQQDPGSNRRRRQRLCGSDSFKIGERNIQATLAWLTRNGFNARNQVTGGTVNRTLHLDVGTGMLGLKAPDADLSFNLSA